MEKKQPTLPEIGGRPLRRSTLINVRSVLLANACEDLFDIMVTLAGELADELAKGAIQDALEVFRNNFHPHFDEWRHAEDVSP